MVITVPLAPKDIVVNLGSVTKCWILRDSSVSTPELLSTLWVLNQKLLYCGTLCPVHYGRFTHLFIATHKCLPVLPLIIWVPAIPEYPGQQAEGSDSISVIVFCIEDEISDIGKVRDIMKICCTCAFGKNVSCLKPIVHLCPSVAYVAALPSQEAAPDL